MEEELEQGDAEQREGGVAGRAGLPPDAGDQQAECEQRPRDGVSHVAGEHAGELEREHVGAGGREEVGDLEVEEQEGEHDPKRVEQRGGVQAEDPLAGRGHQPRPGEKRGGDQAVRVEIPVEDRRGAAGVVFQDGRVERQPGERDDQENRPRGAQARVRHAVEKPEQRRALEPPRDREPLPVELDGEDQGDEKQRHAAAPRELVEPLRVVRRHLLQDGAEAAQRGQGEKGGHDAEEIIRPRGLDRLVNHPEMRDAAQRGDGPRSGEAGEFPAEEERVRGKHGVETDIPDQGPARLRRIEVARMPRVFERGHAGQRAGRQPFQRHQPRQPERQHHEEQRQPEHGGRIGHRQPQAHHDEQQEGQQRGERGDLRAGVPEDRGQLLVPRRDRDPAAELAGEPQAGGEEEHGEATDDEEQGRGENKRHRHLENAQPRGQQREHQRGGHGDERGAQHGQPDGEQVDQQDGRPDQERHGLELVDGKQHQQQRERREKLAPPGRSRGRAVPPEQQGKDRVQRGEQEVDGQGPRQHPVGEGPAGPDRQQGKDQETGDQVELGQPVVQPRDRQQEGVGQQDEAEQQSRARRHRGVVHEEQGEGQRDHRQGDGGPQDRRAGPLLPAGDEIDGEVERAEDQAHRDDHGGLFRGKGVGGPAHHQQGGHPRGAGHEGALLLAPRQGEKAQADQDDEAEEEPGAAGGLGKAEEKPREAKRDRRQRDRGIPQQGRGALQAAGDLAGAEEKRAEPEADGHGGGGFLRRIKFPGPPDQHDHRAGGAQGHEIEPAPVQGDRDEPEVEQGEITEQPAGIVHAGREQDGREKAAEDAEDGHDLRLQPHGEDERRRGDQRHQEERRHRAEELEMIDRAAGKRDRVE